MKYIPNKFTEEPHYADKEVLKRGNMERKRQNMKGISVGHTEY